MSLTEEQRKKLDRIAAEHELVDNQISTIPLTSRGDNFMGTIFSVTIKNDEKKLELILKAAPQTQIFSAMFFREVYVYNHVFKEFKNFEEEHKISNPFRCVPKIYDFSTEYGNEYIIMENLKPMGYQHVDKKIPMNSEHIKAALKEYAKFHAISLAMSCKKPQIFDKLVDTVKEGIITTSMIAAKPELFHLMIKHSLSSAYKAVKDNPMLIEYLQKIQNDVSNIYKNVLYQPENQLVLIHGDCWCNNILFKYEDDNNRASPSSLHIIDWQVAYLSSPAVDFCYFLLLHSTKEILEDYKTYSKFYYDTLAFQLRNFNCQPDQLFPYSKFECHIKRFMKFGLFLSARTLKIMLCDSEEAPDFSEAKKEMAIINMLSFNFKNIDAYKERITTLLCFVKDHNFL